MWRAFVFQSDLPLSVVLPCFDLKLDAWGWIGLAALSLRGGGGVKEEIENNCNGRMI